MNVAANAKLLKVYGEGTDENGHSADSVDNHSPEDNNHGFFGVFQVSLGGIAVIFHVNPNGFEFSLGGYLVANGGADDGYHNFGQFLIGSCALKVFDAAPFDARMTARTRRQYSSTVIIGLDPIIQSNTSGDSRTT